MPYRLKDSETLAGGIKRIAFDQLDQALNRLEPKARNRDKAVHDARICFKRMRAVLRLIHGEIGKEAFRFENRTYRDAGRQLAALRDTTVIAGTLEDLAHRFDKEFADSDIKLLRKKLRGARVRQQNYGKEALAQVADLVKQGRQRVETWPIKTDSFSALKFGIQRVYKRGLVSFELARVERTTENFHEWRKQVKYLLYQLSILNPIWPKPMDTLAREMGKLADYLSEDHDLALLRKTATQSVPLAEGDTERLLSFVDERRGQLETKALALGARLYADRPGIFANRLRAYWEVWRPPVAEPAEQLTLAAYAAVASDE